MGAMFFPSEVGLLRHTVQRENVHGIQKWEGKYPFPQPTNLALRGKCPLLMHIWSLVVEFYN